MNELVFEATQEDGGYCSECLSENIFTQGDSWEAVRANVQEAVRAFYFDQLQAPKRIRLHLVRDAGPKCQINGQRPSQAHENAADGTC